MMARHCGGTLLSNRAGWEVRRSLTTRCMEYAMWKHALDVCGTWAKKWDKIKNE
jgi:hypothetical protein